VPGEKEKTDEFFSLREKKKKERENIPRAARAEVYLNLMRKKNGNLLPFRRKEKKRKKK